MIDKILIIFIFLIAIGITLMILQNVSNKFFTNPSIFQNATLRNDTLSINQNLLTYYNIGLLIFVFFLILLDAIISILYPNKILALFDIIFLFILYPLYQTFLKILPFFSNVLSPLLISILSSSYFIMFIYFILIISIILNFRENKGAENNEI